MFTTTSEPANSPPTVILEPGAANVVNSERSTVDVPAADASQDVVGDQKKWKQPHKPPSQDFLDCASLLILLLIAQDYDPNIETPCVCRKGPRTVQCQDCQEYKLSCRDCWVNNHLNNPWHWARIWNGSFFVCSNISTLHEDYAVQLGHHGKPCPTLSQPKPVKFTVTHSNGVHGTRLSFCNCGQGSHVEQLMRARLSPASLVEPETAFTLAMMRE